MPDTPITSNQTVRTADIACVPMRDIVAAVLVDIPFGGEILQKKIIENGGAFQDLLRPSLEQLVRRVLLHLSGVKHPAALDIEKYFIEVFGVTIDLTGVPFPEKEGFPAYMVRPVGLDEGFVLDHLAQYFGVDKYTWLSPVAEKVDRTSEQKRPQGLYVFAHVGGDEPDANHLGKSYDDAIKKGLVFANPLEYLLMTGFHMWKHKKWMDVKGWTRTSSLWSDGGVVDGCWSLSDRELCLAYGNRADRSTSAGPRELFLG
jgi:hypothetical protein